MCSCGYVIVVLLPGVIVGWHLPQSESAGCVPPVGSVVGGMPWHAWQSTLPMLDIKFAAVNTGEIFVPPLSRLLPPPWQYVFVHVRVEAL